MVFCCSQTPLTIRFRHLGTAALSLFVVGKVASRFLCLSCAFSSAVRFLSFVIARQRDPIAWSVKSVKEHTVICLLRLN